MLENGPVNFVVPHYTTCHAGVAHDLCAGAAAYTHFLRIHFAIVENVFCIIGIREGHTPGTDQGGQAVAFVCRRNIRKKSSQPAITRADHGNIGELLLNFTRQVDEPVDTHQRMFRLLVSAHNRFIEGPAHMRVVIWIRYRDIHQPKATLSQQPDQLLRLGQVRLRIIVFVDGPAVRIRNSVVNSKPHRSDGVFAEFLMNLINDFQRKPRSVLE